MNITVINEFIDAIPQDLIVILKQLEFYGFDIRIVGGAVRDLMMGVIPRDIDIATDATPDEIIFILNKMYKEHKFKQIDTGGLQHGTVKVLTDAGNLYEITSLAYKIRERNQTIKVQQHRDWKLDAIRRDFTFNAMSMNMDGIVYDYLGGMQDLANQRVRFIGFYRLKIMMEPIMILRFAKVLAKFPEPKYNQTILKFISSRKSIIDTIDKETIQWFLAEIKKGAYPASANPVLQALQLAPALK